MSAPGRIGLIARNTFLEAVRQKFFNVLVVLSIAMIASANFFRQFDFGSSELKFIADFGMGAIFLFGSILSVVVTAQLFFSEIENRTALTMLAKPVYRWEFIVGKFLGVFIVLFAFVTLMLALLAAVLYWRESGLMNIHPEDFEDGRLVNYLGIVELAFSELLKFGVLAAITMLIASFSNTNLYTVVLSFFVMVICQLQYIARDNWSDLDNPLLRGLVWFLSLLFPNFQMFNVGEQLIFPTHDATLSTGGYLGIIAYGSIYICMLLGLSAYSFRNREI
ncbi:ABC transporter permease [Cerasicoccus maritimus]|uniref:ABC transporter permease n=1 Tax=Cerasicoccus maritimus TaxID=490089 RepID=UPI002852BACD|nr:ABC transporter permease subunit [Cerasicoccus maritimus]